MVIFWRIPCPLVVGMEVDVEGVPLSQQTGVDDEERAEEQLEESIE